MIPLGELAKALCKAQQEIKPAVKDKVNPFYKSPYASLESTWEACREALAKNGLSISQTTAYREGQTLLVTTLLHESGQLLSGEFPIFAEKQTPQGLGSAMSYARRYTLKAILNMMDEDDDGEHAEKAYGRGQGKPVPVPKYQAPPEFSRKDPDFGEDVTAIEQKIDALVIPHGKFQGVYLREKTVDVWRAELKAIQEGMQGFTLEQKKKAIQNIDVIQMYLGHIEREQGFKRQIK